MLSPIGAAAPTSVVAVDPHARWLVMCQATIDSNRDGKLAVTSDMHHGNTYGDELSAYLALGNDKPERIRRFLGQSYDGRYLAVEAAGRILLIDVETGDRVDLSSRGAHLFADKRNSPVAFDEGGHVLYMQHGRVATFVRRVLVDGTERRYPTESTIVTGLALSKDGRWVNYLSVDDDTDGNGVLEAPMFSSTLSGSTCRGPALGWSVHRASGDTAVLRGLSTTGIGESVRLSKDVQQLGDSLLARESDGGHVLISPELKRRRISSPACDGALLAAHVPTMAILLGCKSEVDEGFQRVTLFRGGKRFDLGIEREVGRSFALAEPDIQSEAEPGIAFIYDIGITHSINLRTGKVSSGCKRFSLGRHGLSRGCFQRQAPPTAECNQWNRRSCAYVSDRAVLATSKEGLYLVASSVSGKPSGEFALGPLSWIRPESPQPPATPPERRIEVPSCAADNSVLCVLSSGGTEFGGTGPSLPSASRQFANTTQLRFDGKKWVVAKSFATPHLRDLYVVSDNEMWMVGGEERPGGADANYVWRWDGELWFRTETLVAIKRIRAVGDTLRLLLVGGAILEVPKAKVNSLR